METGKINREQISTFADGELEDEQINRALLALREPAQHATWTLYHQIGDALRCEHMAAPLSADFSSRMAARLEAEPTLLAPQKKTAARGLLHSLTRSSGAWAAVAAATMAFVIAPQLMPSRHGAQLERAPASLASTAPQSTLLAQANQAGKLSMPPQRAAEIDEYFLAHQNLNASLYGSAQLARPATLNGEAGQ